MNWTFHPLTTERWDDFERLFGAKGACGGCWCMWWRAPRARWNRDKGEGNRRAMKAIVDGGEMPGILAYDGAEPVGWCAVAPRERFVALEKARTLQPVDDRPTWSAPCLFVRREYRNRGLSAALLEAAAAFAREQGAERIEGYPNVPKARMPDAFAWTGLLSSFERAGFAVCAAPSERRRIVRRELAGS